MGQITINTAGSFGNRVNVESALEGGHNRCYWCHKIVFDCVQPGQRESEL